MELTDKMVRNYWRKVSKREATDCWPWLGCIGRRGYGHMRIGDKTKLATHVALTLAGLPRPADAKALHSCDNPHCVNPAHLRWGTHEDNMRDRDARGRTQRILTEAIVLEARKRFANGERVHDIALTFGVNRETLRSAVKGQKWRWLKEVRA